MTIEVESEKEPVDGIPVLANGAKLLGEAFIPGASLIMDGKVVNGAVHAVIGIGVRAALGPVGFAVVAADSYSKSVTDKYIWDHVSDVYGRVRSRRETAEMGGEEGGTVIDAEATPDDSDDNVASGKRGKSAKS